MAILFHGGFEEGDLSKFNGTIITNGAVNVVAVMPHLGVYHGRFTVSPVSGFCNAACYKNVESSSLLYARGFFYINSPLPTAAEGDRFHLIIFQEGWNPVAYAGVVRRWDGAVCWQLMCRNGQLWVTKTVESPRPTVGRYCCVELFWTIAGAAQLFIDGVLVAEITGVDTSAFGNVARVNFGVAEKAGTAFEVDVFGDDFVIADQYIGMEPPPVVKLAVTYLSQPIAVDATIQGQIVPSGTTIQIDEGTSVTMSVPGDSANLYFNKWLINNVEYTANPLTLDNVTSNLTIIAVYSEVQPPPADLVPLGLSVVLAVADSALVILALAHIAGLI